MYASNEDECMNYNARKDMLEKALIDIEGKIANLKCCSKFLCICQPSLNQQNCKYYVENVEEGSSKCKHGSIGRQCESKDAIKEASKNQ